MTLDITKFARCYALDIAATLDAHDLLNVALGQVSEHDFFDANDSVLDAYKRASADRSEPLFMDDADTPEAQYELTAINAGIELAHQYIKESIL